MIAGLLSLLLAPAPAATPEMHAMTDAPRALALEVDARDGMIEVRLTGHAAEARAVRYTLEVTGRSTARHRGSTTLAAGTPAVLSTLRTAAEGDWCVRLLAEEEGRAPYEITRGACTAAG